MSAALWALDRPNNPMTATRTDPTPMQPAPASAAATHTLTWTPSAEAARKMLGAFAIGGAFIGLIDFSVSFWSVAAAARPYLGAASWTLPLLVDLGIFVLSGVSLTLELHRISSKWVRVIPTGLAAFTVYLNTATQHAWFGKGVHAAGPALWIAVVEIGMFTVRRLVGLSSETAMDKVRASRWLLAPLSTFRLWRRMRLWEVREYSVAIGREHRVSASRALLRQWYGRAWRSKAPRGERLAVALQATTDRSVADLLTEASAGIMAAAAAARKPSDSASGNASEQDSNPASHAAQDGQAPARNRTGGRPKTGHQTREKVATIAAKYPDATVPELAKKARLSRRTVQRYLPAAAPASGSPSVEHANGVAA